MDGPSDLTTRLIPQKVYTFQIVGGEAFEVTGMAMNPDLIHDGEGRRTLWKMVGTEEEKDRIVAGIEPFGAVVEVYTEEESDLQREIRQRRHEASSTTFAYPCKQCPTCFFFDPMMDTKCGLVSWPPGQVSAASTMPKAREDAEACPFTGQE